MVGWLDNPSAVFVLENDDIDFDGVNIDRDFKEYLQHTMDRETDGNAQQRKLIVEHSRMFNPWLTLRAFFMPLFYSLQFLHVFKYLHKLPQSLLKMLSLRP